MAYVAHKLHHEAQVVDGGEAGVEGIVDFEQMMQVADGVMAAGVTVTVGRKGFVPFD